MLFTMTHYNQRPWIVPQSTQGIKPKARQIEREKNIEWDARDYAALKEQGWNVLIIWECKVKKILRTKIIPDLPSRISAPYPTDENMPESAALMAAVEESEWPSSHPLSIRHHSSQANEIPPT